MDKLIRKYIPEAPKMGLYVAPNIPSNKLKNALKDYAKNVRPEDVLALYDCTLMGSAKDGAVFTTESLTYQNNDLEPPQTIRYTDIVNLNIKKRFLGGRELEMDVNRANATVTHTLDFSGQPDAAEYVARFLHEAMLYSVHEAEKDPPGYSTTGSDLTVVNEALKDLRDAGLLSVRDYHRILEVLLED